MTQLWIGCAAVVLLLAPAPAVRQQAPVFSARATGVRVDALVTDRNVPVRGLTAADFELRDNGIIQDIDIVESSDVPINVVLAFDGSASTGGRRISDLGDAANALIAGLKANDRIALITFNHAVAPRVPLTSDVMQVGQALRGIDPRGQSAILDGIHTALMTTQREAGRSLVIVCTDGQDTQSWLLVDEVTEAARQSNAVIYAVAAGAARRWSDLSDLTELTGGHTIGIERSSDFRAELVRVLEEFRSRYVLTFTPRGVKAGGFHTLEVKVRRSGLKVRFRPGYVGSPPKGRP
jgi:Ca-activated chloride channel family protein